VSVKLTNFSTSPVIISQLSLTVKQTATINLNEIENPGSFF